MNIDTTGKPKRKLVKSAVVGPAIVLVLVASSYLARGWIRVTVVPKTIQFFEASNVQKQTEAELGPLGDPFKALGFKSIKKGPSACVLDSAKNFSSEVNCSYTVSAFDKITNLGSSKTELDTASKRIENALQVNGWKGEYSDTGQYTSLHLIITKLANDIDSTPDSTYTKQVGDLFCIYQVTAASSKPDLTAMAARMACEKNYKVFGAVIF